MNISIVDGYTLNPGDLSWEELKTLGTVNIYDRSSPEELIERSRDELGAPLMADVDSVDNGLRAAELGCSWIGTTLFGYTGETKELTPPGWDLLGPLREQLPSTVPLICEGGIASAAMAAQALDRGANCVVVGTAITGVDLQVAAYCRQIAR